MNRKKGIILGLFAGLLWGLDGILIQIYLSKLSVADNSILITPIICAALHDGFAGLWIFVKNVFSRKVKLYIKALKGRSVKFLILGSILGGPLGMTGNLMGIQFAGSAYSYSITACYPVLGVILGKMFLKENVKYSAVLGVLLSVVGAIIVGYGPSGAGSYFYIGIACSILAIVGWALEGTISTYSMNYIDSDIAIGIREIASFTVYTIIIVMDSINIINVINNFNVFILVAASLTGAVSYLCWYRAMKLLGVSISMSLNITYALWSVFFSWVLLGQKITYSLFMGVIFITAGTIFTIKSVKYT